MLVPFGSLSQARRTKAARDHISTDIKPKNGHANIVHLINVSISNCFGNTASINFNRHEIISLGNWSNIWNKQSMAYYGIFIILNFSYDVQQKYNNKKS